MLGRGGHDVGCEAVEDSGDEEGGIVLCVVGEAGAAGEAEEGDESGAVGDEDLVVKGLESCLFEHVGPYPSYYLVAERIPVQAHQGDVFESAKPRWPILMMNCQRARSITKVVLGKWERQTSGLAISKRTVTIEAT